MKPFTLEWWLKMYIKADSEERRCLRRFHYLDSEGQTIEMHLVAKRGLYLKELMQWIINRIINKYGEQE